jgi:hypothetical protein
MSHGYYPQERNEVAGSSPRKDQHPVSKSFATRRDAEAWAREMERRADLGELTDDRRLLHQYTLVGSFSACSDLRYRRIAALMMVDRLKPSLFAI